MTMDLPWPDPPSFPSYGYVIPRHDLDQIVCERAAKAGAVVWEGAEAVSPLFEGPSSGGAADPAGGAGDGSRPSCVGAVVRDLDHGGTVEMRARYVVVCDGANSRFGRA